MEGESVVFKVVVSGKPVPTLTWYHNDVEITNNYSQEILDDGSLSIPTTEVKQAGVYKLLARNSAGSVQQQVKLNVQLEKDKTPDFGGTAMTIPPVPVSGFGEYVAHNHASNNQGFRDQFAVSVTIQSFSDQNCQMSGQRLTCQDKISGQNVVIKVKNLIH